MYLGGGGNRGMNPIGWQKTSASVPAARCSPNSETSSFDSDKGIRFLLPINRLRNEVPFLQTINTLGEIEHEISMEAFDAST